MNDNVEVDALKLLCFINKHVWKVAKYIDLYAIYLVSTSIEIRVEVQHWS